MPKPVYRGKSADPRMTRRSSKDGSLQVKSADLRVEGRSSRNGSLAWITPKVILPPGFQSVVAQKQKTPAKDDKSAKQLLGELYTDKEYLNKMYNDRGIYRIT